MRERVERDKKRGGGFLIEAGREIMLDSWARFSYEEIFRVGKRIRVLVINELKWFEIFGEHSFRVLFEYLKNSRVVLIKVQRTNTRRVFTLE